MTAATRWVHIATPSRVSLADLIGGAIPTGAPGELSQRSAGVRSVARSAPTTARWRSSRSTDQSAVEEPAASRMVTGIRNKLFQGDLSWTTSIFDSGANS